MKYQINNIIKYLLIYYAFRGLDEFKVNYIYKYSYNYIYNYNSEIIFFIIFIIIFPSITIIILINNLYI